MNRIVPNRGSRRLRASNADLESETGQLDTGLGTNFSAGAANVGYGSVIGHTHLLGHPSQRGAIA